MVKTAKLEDTLTAWMNRHQTPGLAAAILADQRIVLTRGYGLTSVEEGAVPVTSTTLFRILSTTKMLVGTAVMRLVEWGVLALDAPISIYLPWLRLSQLGLENVITLRHLLSHTSGLCHFPADFTSGDPDGLEVWAHEYLPSYPVLTPPGKVWLYSNTGLCLAAYVVQVVTATPFAALMQDLLFGPLGMEHTTFDPLVALTYPCAQGHNRRLDGGWEVDHQFVHNTAWDPAGGALSCVQDLAQVALLYLQQGTWAEQRLLSAETIVLMQTPHVKCWTRDEGGYGLTWATGQYKGHTLVRHNGGGVSSFQSVFILAPAQGSAVVLLANGRLQTELVQQLLDEVLAPSAEEPQPVMPHGDEASWPGYCGTYLGPYSGLIEIEAEDQHLCLTRNGTRYVLEPHCPQHYLGKGDEDHELVSVGFPGHYEHMQLADFVVVDDSPCERLASRPVVTEEPEKWARYVGSYELPGGALMLERSVRVDMQGQMLFLTWGAKSMPCIPIAAATFACDAGVIAFLETDDGILLEFQRTMRARPVAGDDGCDAISHLAADRTIPIEVPNVLMALLAGIQTALGDNLVGVYLRGSLATGDFDPRTSDIDFFVVTDKRVGDEEFAALATMHEQLAQRPNRYARHLEGTYIERTAVRRFQPGERYPTIYRQEQLAWSEHHCNWLLERWVIREHGVILSGPEPRSLIDPISPSDLQRAVRLRLYDWQDWANQPDDPDWRLPLSHNAYVIETMCRALCTLATGTLPSKRHAVTWALETLPQPWRTAVERSQEWHAEQSVDTSRNDEVRRFIHWIASQAQGYTPRASPLR